MSDLLFSICVRLFVVCICTTAITWGFIVLGRALVYVLSGRYDEESSEAQAAGDKTGKVDGEAQ